MKIVVVYQSSTGFTKQYAEWIAGDCGCKAQDIKKISENELSQYDTVIYGGWIMGNMIMGVDKIIKINPNKLIVFAVGSTPDGEEIKTAIKEQNHLGDIPFFYFEGGFHFEKLNFPTRIMLKVMKKSVEKRENKTKQDEYMGKILGTSFDNSDKRFIEPLVTFIKQVI